MTTTTDAPDEEHTREPATDNGDEEASVSVRESLQLSKLVLEVAVLVARLIRML